MLVLSQHIETRHVVELVTAGGGFGYLLKDRVLDVFALDFAGNHRRHEARSSASEHVRCVFTTAPEPDCTSHVAIGGSLLIFKGREVVAGTNRFAGATGRVVSSKEVEGGSDVVVRVTRARSRRAE